MQSCHNYDLENIVTLLNIDRFATLLKEMEYDAEESEFLIDGFTNGFDIGYQGPQEHKSQAENIPLTVGSREERS